MMNEKGLRTKKMAVKTKKAKAKKPVDERAAADKREAARARRWHKTGVSRATTDWMKRMGML